MLSVKNAIAAIPHSELKDAALAKFEALITALDDVGEGVAVVDIASQRIEFANDALSAILGYESAELLTMETFWSLVPPELLASSREGYLDVAQGKPVKTKFETIALAKNGKRIAIAGNFTSIIHSGRPGFVVIVRDVTAQKEAAAAVRESDERVRMIVENLPLVVFAIDRVGKIIFSKGQGLAALGMEHDDQIGRKADDISNELNVPEASIAFRRALAGETVPITATVKGLTFDMTYVPFRDPSGTIIGVLGVALDVTQRKHAERSVLQAQEEQQQLIAEMAHGLQTPLTALKGQLDAIARQHDPSSQSLATVNRSIDRVSKIVYDLLKLSRLERDIEKDSVPVDLSALLCETVEYLQVLAEERGIEVVARIDPDVFVIGKGDQIEDLVTNLASNAMKYITDDCPTRRVEFTLTADADNAVLAVRDTGIGIAAADISNIFRPFYRGQGSSEADGVGLGLAICRRIVTRHRGVIDVRSAPDSGTVFTVTLPLRSPYVAFDKL